MVINSSPYSTFPNLALSMYNKKEYTDNHKSIIDKMKNQVKKSS